jgi:hypothetical protein
VNIKELKEAALKAAYRAGYVNGACCFIGEGEDDLRVASEQSWDIHRDELVAGPTILSLIARVEQMEEALRNAKGFLDTPIRRRQFAGDEFYYAVTASIRAALEAPANPIEEVANVQR